MENVVRLIDVNNIPMVEIAEPGSVIENERGKRVQAKVILMTPEEALRLYLQLQERRDEFQRLSGLTLVTIPDEGDQR